jgi:hypothetical protein
MAIGDFDPEAGAHRPCMRPFTSDIILLHTALRWMYTAQMKTEGTRERKRRENGKRERGIGEEEEGGGGEQGWNLRQSRTVRTWQDLTGVEWPRPRDEEEAASIYIAMDWK